ncbi:MAG: hypothetical protein JNK56_15295 [Myxococcales bacterium]|nr:hypothetical protein [Myxococcales bacterium]
MQHVKVTLQEEDSGETVVIEQRSDGQIRCERGKSGKGGRETKAAPAEVKAAPEPAREAEKPKGPEKESTRTTAKKTASAPRQRRASSLEWKPTKDAGYEGFVARSEGGQFKVLRAKGSMWALFFERVGVKAEPLGCYVTLDKGKVRAQALHDKGMPAPEVQPITAVEIVQVCPAPPETEDKPEKQEKSEAKAPDTVSVDAGADAELMNSLASTIKQSIAGMDDDD